MKTRFQQKFVLAASVLAALSSSKAFSQGAAAPALDSSLAARAPAAVARASANVANPDQVDVGGNFAPLRPRAEHGAIAHPKPEDVHFSFKHPATTRRPGHPGDRDIRLSEREIGELNRIGEALVELVDSDYRISTNKNEKIETMLKELREEEAVRFKALGEARKNRKDAQIAVLDVKEKLKLAKAVRDERQNDFNEAEKRLNELKAKMDQEVNDIDALNQSIGKLEGDVASAGKDVDAAASRLQRKEDEAKTAQTALDKAKGDFRAATNALAVATVDAGRADEALEKARENAEEARKKAAAAAVVVAEAEGALKEAKGKDVAAKKAVDRDKGALKRAQEKVEKAQDATAKARAAAEAAAKARDAARPANPDEKQGFWARRRLRRAERRAEKRARAAAEADEALKAVAAAVPGAKTKLEGSEKTAAEAAAALKEKTAARDAAAGRKRVADKDAKDARSAVNSASEKAEKLHDEIATHRREGERAEARIGEFTRKCADLKKEGEALSALKKAADAKEGELKGNLEKIKSATDNEHKVNLVHEVEKTKLEDGVVKALDALEIAKGKVEEIGKLDTPEMQAALEKAIEEENEAREAYRNVLAGENHVSVDAEAAAQRDEKELEARNEKALQEFWGVFREGQRMSAADAPNTEKSKADTAFDAARAAEEKAGGDLEKATAALAAAKTAAAAAKEGLEAAKKTVREADRAVSSAEKKAQAATNAATLGAKAVADAEAALEGAKDAAAAAESVKVANEKKAALEGAKSAAESELKQARQKRDEAAKAFDAAEKAAADAENALAKALDDKGAADAALKGARRDSAEAKNAVAVSDKAVAGARAETDRAVNVLIAAFDEQVAETRRRKRNAIEWLLIDSNEKERREAREARRNYIEARRLYAASRKALGVQRRRYERKEIQWDTQEYVNARADYSEKRTAFEKAEDDYNKYYSDSHSYRTAALSNEEADRQYETEEALRGLHGVQFRGDRRWLARTSVNGEPLLDSFLGEMEWQADQVGERDPADPSRVTLTPEQAVECARIAAATVQRRAVYGGFYFAGLEVELVDGVPVCLVDKGRYGPIDVVFEVDSTNDVKKASSDVGRIFNSTNILAKLGSKAGDTNALDAVREGEAFNFIAFRKNFNALNANPDIVKADAEFKPVEGFDYGYEAEDGEMGTNRTTRAIAATVTVQEKPWPAPLHGVLSIDNFNSMGDADRPIGEVDTWMARLTLQTLDLWDLGHALTLNGNVSLGTSLYGGAASYYIPREEGTWGDGAWRRLSGWSWTFHGGYTEVSEDDVVPKLDVLGTGYYGGLQASSSLVDFNDSSIDVSLGLTYRYVENSVRIGGNTFRLGPNGGDGYEILPLSLAFMYAEKGLDEWRGRNYATVEGVFNLGVSAAEDLKAFRSAIEDDRYMILRAQFARINLLWEDAMSFFVPRILFLRADAQWASTPVIGAEQYGLGGHGTLRGYAEREFMGDSGASGTVEFRTPIGLGYFDRHTSNAYRADDRLQFVYFADFGYFMLEDGTTNADGLREDDSEFLASLGVGLRYSYGDFVFRFDWGVPLVRGDRVPNSDERTFETSSAGVGHLSLQYQF